jgi:DUF1680 family protein
MRPWILVLATLLAASAAPAGDLSDRYRLTLDRVLRGGPPFYTEDFVLKDAIPEHVRRFTEYSGDVSGRYVGALAAAAADLDRAIPPLDGIVPKLIRLQKPDGFFGDGFHYDNIGEKDMALIWGNGRLLIGLLEYHRYRPEPETLAAARRIAEFLLRLAPVMNSEENRQRFDRNQFASAYICWTQNIEAFAELYRLTKDERYLRVAEQIADFTGRGPSSHAHGFLTALRGIVELYRVGGDRKFLDQAEREWQSIVDSGEVLLPGSVPEAWRPNMTRTEGCGEADWVRLTLALWQTTAKPKYLEMAERTIFNELAMNEFNTGDFGNRTFAPNGVAGHGASRAWWCCTLHGLRCFPDIVAGAFRARQGTLLYDLPVDGRVRDEGLAVRAESSLGRNGTAAILVTASDGNRRAIAIRRPEWSSTVALRLNGTPLNAVERDGYLHTERAWKTGDRLLVSYALKTRAVRKPDSQRVALFHGPWLLGVDDAGTPAWYDEVHERNRLAIEIGADGAVQLQRLPAPQTRPFSVPVAQFQVMFQHGGYPVQPARAVLRPLAEQTGMPATSWEYWFTPTAANPR